MDIIKLNVGGKIFTTTKTTLSTSKYFEALFRHTNFANKVDAGAAQAGANRWNHESTEPYFIDRSGELFEHVLAPA
jgi:hypothetical protein